MDDDRDSMEAAAGGSEFDSELDAALSDDDGSLLAAAAAATADGGGGDFEDLTADEPDPPRSRPRASRSDDDLKQQESFLAGERGRQG